MKSSLLFLILVIVTSGYPAFAQHDHSGVHEENWLRELGLDNQPMLVHRYDRYSREDIEKFKEQVLKFRVARSSDPWEGDYYFDFPDSVTFSRLSWKTTGGFFGFSIFTCIPELSSLRYGRVEATNDSVTFISPKGTADRYIRVRWGHRRYLVHEESVLAFSEKAAGRYVEPEDDDDARYQLWAHYWVATDLEDNPEPKGLPVLPPRFKHLERKPMQARIVKVGPREIRPEVEMGNRIMTTDSAVFSITIDKGTSAGFATGMTLVNTRTGEEVYLQSVTETAATGILVRSLDDAKRDICSNDEERDVVCPNLKPGQLLSTNKTSFWF